MSKRSMKHLSVAPFHGLVWKSSIAVLIVTVSLVSAGIAQAETTPGPGWEATSRLYPTHLAPGQQGMVVVEVYNTGKGSSTGPVTMTDVLPPGLEATSSGLLAELGSIATKKSIETKEKKYQEYEKHLAEGQVANPLAQAVVWNCGGTSVVTCVTGPGYEAKERPIKLGYIGRIGIVVTATGEVGTAANRVTVGGGGSPATAEASDDFTISESPVGFGLAGEADGWFAATDGSTDTQAGSHPFGLTISFGLNTLSNVNTLINGGPSGSLRDVSVALPPGIVGNPHAVPQCTREQLLSTAFGGCPPDTAVGVDYTGLGAAPAQEFGDQDFRIEVYNMVPPAGVPAEFA